MAGFGVSCCFSVIFNCMLFLSCENFANTYDVKKPLILTPYLKVGKIKEAQQMSATNIGDVTSYTGYFTVNENCGNNLFFWFILAKGNWQEAPVLLWLNGGPGFTSLYGLFQENGPWDHLPKGFVHRNSSWTNSFNVVYFDQPVGTGFSFSDMGCYAEDITTLATEMTSALFQFFNMFPALQKNKFFLTGESSAGHYLPAIAVEIDKQNPISEVKINLIGLVVSNPFLDARCIDTADYLFELGIIDRRGRDKTKNAFEEYVRAINAKDYARAYELDGDVYGGEFYMNAELFSPYNILLDQGLGDLFQLFIRDYEVRKQIHVGITPFTISNDDVFDKLYKNDNYVSISPRIEYLLKTNKYIVGFYAGQLDMSCLYSSLPCVLGSLDWEGTSQYLNATRHPWYFSGRLAGWFKVVGNLFDVAVRNCGHMVPVDQGGAALDLITAVVADTPGTTLLTRLRTAP